MKPITVAAGHGGNDPGAVVERPTEEGGGFTRLVEGEIVRDLRNQVAARLRLMGREVRTDGTGLVNLPLVESIRLIAGSAIAVEFHTDASENILATGVSVFSLPVYKAKSQKLAQVISETLGLKLRGDLGWVDQAQSHRGRLGFVSMGGLLVETFFLTNAVDCERYRTNQGALADALAKCLYELAPV
jgi:N-acetylmuramoyl-L-alanine amidase